VDLSGTSVGDALVNPPGRRRGRPLAPPLADPTRFRLIEGVPIYDTHTRKRKSSGKVVSEEVDADQLGVICRNTQQAIDDGENPQVFLGHTTDDGPETDQPPTAGFVGKVYVDEYMGRPTIRADLYIRHRYDDAVDEFPRRSVEVVGKLTPEGRITDLALLKRLPERPLGTLARSAATPGEAERYVFPQDGESVAGGSAMNDQDVEKIVALLLPALGKMVTDIFTSVMDRMANTPAPEEEEMPETLPEEGLGGEEEGLGGEPPPMEAEGGEGEGGEPFPPEEGGEEGLPEEEGGEELPPEEGEEGEEEPEEEEAEPMARHSAAATNDRLELARLRAQVERNNKQTARRQAAHEKQIAELQRESRVSRREVELTTLHTVEGYQFDLGKMLERCADLSEAEFLDKVAEIRECYTRVDTSEGYTPHDPYPAAAPAAARNDPLAEYDPLEVVRYCQQEGYGPERYQEGLDAFVAMKKGRAAVA
jgi:hypothetical protein